MKGLEVENLSVQYHTDRGEKQVLEGISFSVEPGEIAGIVGASGSGKTTAMLAVMGLLGGEVSVSADRILVSGKPVTPGRGIAMVFQDSLSCLNPTVKIGRQITETIRSRRRCTAREARERAEELLDLVGIRDPALRMGQYPFELSGGMRQRTAIAIALACEPDVVIADEPTTALDAVVQVQILRLLRRIVRETGASLLLVSHDMGVIASMCGTVYVMRSGRIIERGTAEEIFYSPSREYTRRLLEDARGGAPGPAEVPRGKAGMSRGRKDGSREKILLQLDGVTKRFGTREGIRDLSLEIREGEICALAGESGSGKSTLARILSGMTAPDGGEIFYRGREISALRGKARDRVLNGGIQMVFQDPFASLNPCLTAGETLEEALRAKDRGRKAGMTAVERRRRAEEMLVRVGLSGEDADRYPDEFSGGERQRVGIARALIPEPELLICDEALSGLDASTGRQILDLILELQRERNIACLFISHDLSLIRRISGRIHVLYRGRTVEAGETKTVCSDPWHPYTKALLSAALPPDPLRAGKVRPALPAENEAAGEDGCPYAASCGYAMECCFRELPEPLRFGDRETACFLYSEKHTGKRSERYRMTSQI